MVIAGHEPHNEIVDQLYSVCNIFYHHQQKYITHHHLKHVYQLIFSSG